MKKIVIAFLAVTVLFKLEAQTVPVCTELFISEYVEGSRNNKALEIYNPTSDTVDLTQYRVTRWQNGSATWAAQYSDKLSGKLAPKDVVILVLDRRDTTQIGQDTPVVLPLRLKADLFLSKDYNTSFSMSFNGDDAMSLDRYNSKTAKYDLVDIFGKIGERPSPGWSDKEPYTGTGLWYSVDKTLIRKASIQTGLDTFMKGAYQALNPKLYFNPALEWNVNPRDMFDSLGTHDCVCNTASLKGLTHKPSLRVFPVPASSELFVNTSAIIQKAVILGMDGRIVLENANTTYLNENSMVKLDIAALQCGMFVLQIITNNGEILSQTFAK